MQELKLFVEQMRATSSSLDKVEILKQQSEFIKKVLEYTYNPYKQYNVTSKTCKKNSGLFKYNTYKDVFELLDDLTNRKITAQDKFTDVNDPFYVLDQEPSRAQQIKNKHVVDAVETKSCTQIAADFYSINIINKYSPLKYFGK